MCFGHESRRLVKTSKQTPQEILNKMIKNVTWILGVLAAVASLSLADSAPEASAQDTKKMVQNNFVETAQKGVKLSLWESLFSFHFDSDKSSFSFSVTPSLPHRSQTA